MVVKWCPTIALLAVVGALGGFTLSLIITPIYKADGTLLVLAAPQQQNQMSSGLNLSAGQVTSTYATLVTAKPLLLRVIKELKLPDRPQDLGKKINATPQRDASILDVEVSDADASLAADIANTLMTDFVADISEKNQRRIDKAGSALKNQISQLEQDLADTQQKLVSAQRSKQDTTSIQDHLQAQNALLTQLTSAYSSFSASQVQSLDNVSLVSSATIPETPAIPKRWLNTSLGGVLGLMGGVAIAIAIEYLDQGLRNEDDVRERLNTSTLAVIPVYGRKRPKTPRSRRRDEHVAEAYRRLRTNLRFAAVDRPLRSLVVTSGRIGEGKSCTSASLARSLAASGEKVLLADADMRRPSQHRLFGAPIRDGISEMLVAESHVAVNGHHCTEYPNLTLLTAGTLPPNPSELLSSARAALLFETLAQQHDLTIIDTPPAGVVTDALSLAGRASATIVVVEAGKTSARQARQTIEALRAVGANVVGVVLNKASRRKADGYYYGYYGYQAPQQKARFRIARKGVAIASVAAKDVDRKDPVNRSQL